MQKIKFSYEVPGSNGSKSVTQVATVDEQIGLIAGRDIYATARGTAKRIARHHNPFAWLRVRLEVDDYHVEMSIKDGAWVVEAI